jgi:hypothetical protein
MKYSLYTFICAGLAVFFSSGNAAIPITGLTACYLFNGDARDSGPSGINGTVHNAVLTTDRFGKPDCAYQYNGMDSFIELPDNDIFSVSTTGQMSISAWIRPDTLMFPKWESTGYVHWMGKGQSGVHEWVFRMYNLTNEENRPNRMSFYLFNPAGGLGAGSYAQETVTSGKWMHLVAIANTSSDSITWYKNGVKMDSDPIYNGDYKITPRNGTAPVRIGTRDFASYFKGAIDDIRFYNRALSAGEVLALYNEPGETSTSRNEPEPRLNIVKKRISLQTFGSTGMNAQVRIFYNYPNGAVTTFDIRGRKLSPLRTKGN